jgi:hypothetical protein
MLQMRIHAIIPNSAQSMTDRIGVCAHPLTE